MSPLRSPRIAAHVTPRRVHAPRGPFSRQKDTLQVAEKRKMRFATCCKWTRAEIIIIKKKKGKRKRRAMENGSVKFFPFFPGSDIGELICVVSLANWGFSKIRSASGCGTAGYITGKATSSPLPRPGAFTAVKVHFTRAGSSGAPKTLCMEESLKINHAIEKYVHTLLNIKASNLNQFLELNNTVIFNCHVCWNLFIFFIYKTCS